jgi:hypothetical protein
MANCYALVMTTTIGGLPWRYDFADETDDNAKDCALRWLRPSILPESCMYVELWSTDGPKTSKRIARYKVQPATVAEV